MTALPAKLAAQVGAASRTANLMKKDTITRMLEEVDSSMQFRAAHALEQVTKLPHATPSQVRQTRKEIPLETNFDSIDAEHNERRRDPVATDVNQLGSSRRLSA